MKLFCCNIPDEYLDSGAIRSKKDVVIMILNISNLILNKKFSQFSDDIDKKNDFNLIIRIDKMSRIYIIRNNQIHSFQYPFTVGLDAYSVCYRGFNIDYTVIASLLSLFNDFTDTLQISKLLNSLWDDDNIKELTKEQCKIVEEIIMYLLTFEPGYVRYDKDEEHENGKIHPLNHIDVNYSQKCTYKIGCSHRIELHQLIDFLDTTTECWYLDK